MFARVIVDINNNSLNKTYYYTIPEKYKEYNLKGYRVEVPFGSRKIQGYIVDVIDKIDFDESKIKNLSKIKDDFPVLTEELLLLSDVLADELYCTNIQVIESMIPTILKNKYVEYYKIATENAPQEFLNITNDENIIEKNKLEKLVSKSYLSMLISKKIIKLISISKEQTLSEKTSYIVLNDSVDLKKKRITEKHKLLIDYLKDNNSIEKSKVKEILNLSSYVLNTMLKNELIKIIEKEKEFEDKSLVYINKNTLNEEQAKVYNEIISNINKNKFSEYLLHGVTGSGKTEIYIHLTKKYIDKGKDVIILVPEIILTPQILEKFKNVFGDNIAILHSGLNKKEKYNEWKKIADGKVKICIGTRSAVFAPFKNIGLIIIDEEHEASYKQNETPRYDAKDVAKKRSIYNKSTLVYASATPTVDLYYNFLNFKKKNLLRLNKRYNNMLPDIDIIPVENKEDVISGELLNYIKKTIANKEQVLLFINKRGYTNFIRCFNCQHIYKCENCDISLNYHKIDNTLKCHFCGYSKKIKDVKKCCNSPELVSGIYGIQKVEEFLIKEIPSLKITRMDFDTTRTKGAYDKLLKEFKDGNSNILIGTQMISKGLDFPNITLVGILSVDSIVGMPSFRSNEKLFQLLVQTSGRAGRSEKRGRVIIQSNVDSNIIAYAVKSDYLSFYNYEISRRELLNYPPFYKISFINIKGLDENKVYLASVAIHNFLKEKIDPDKILGPNKSLLYKINNEYTYNIAIRFDENNYKILHKMLNYINNYFKELYKKDNLSIIIDDNPQDYI
ncbi:replication restart helicase PriA [Gemelliphila palaticanis]|uniref:Replication restart protein PriA n=1 Tax=Gemelliphila palaticanis TaxID=81950 RepID=A0ABX2T366_9BACL|nr:primosomal protein N' [Gemella palaticanis]MBF0715735.1 primosomal protein N' [Gemella palaticanis]NYS47665.1 primosomal protein N' [Gemella palaticanis]